MRHFSARKPATSLAIAGMAVWFLSLSPVAAYVDPGGGSYFFQLLIAGLTTTIFFFNRARGWLGSLFAGKPSEDTTRPSATADSANPLEEGDATSPTPPPDRPPGSNP